MGGMVAVQAQTADGKPAVVMLTQAQAQQQGMWTMEGPSPVRVKNMKEMCWDAGSVSDNGEAEGLSRGLSRGSARRESVSVVQKTMTTGPQEEEEKPVVTKAPVNPRGGKTMTWFARHSIYEMG